jgi:hypothetical protein
MRLIHMGLKMQRKFHLCKYLQGSANLWHRAQIHEMGSDVPTSAVSSAKPLSYGADEQTNLNLGRKHDGSANV